MFFKWKNFQAKIIKSHKISTFTKTVPKVLASMLASCKTHTIRVQVVFSCILQLLSRNGQNHGLRAVFAVDFNFRGPDKKILTVAPKSARFKLILRLLAVRIAS